MSDVSTVVNYFPTVNEGFITTVAGSSVSSGGTTVTLASTSGLTNGSVFVGIIEPGQANQQVFTGTVDTGGTQITGVKWTRGSNTVHPIGATVVDYVTGTAINMITTGILKFANQDGSLKAIVAPSATLSGSATVGGTLTVNGSIQNSRIYPRISTTTSTATLTPDLSSANVYSISAQAAALAIANPTGSPQDGDGLIIRIKDNGTSRAITYGTAFSNISGLDSLTATTVGKWHVIGAMYNAGTSTWQILSISTEA